MILQDPAVGEPLLFYRNRRNQHRPQLGQNPDQPQAAFEARISAADVIPLATQLAKVDGIELYLQPVQDLTVEDRVSRTQYQYTLADPDPDELTLDREMTDRLEICPSCETSQRTLQNGLAASLVIDRETASRWEFPLKRSTRLYTMPSGKGRSPPFTLSSTSIIGHSARLACPILKDIRSMLNARRLRPRCRACSATGAVSSRNPTFQRPATERSRSGHSPISSPRCRL